MEKSKVYEIVNEIFKDVFENEKLTIADETTAKDIDGWDSLTHLILINEIETKFKIKFTMGEIQSAKNVGELIDYLIKHIENITNF